MVSAKLQFGVMYTSMFGGKISPVLFLLVKKKKKAVTVPLLLLGGV